MKTYQSNTYRNTLIFFLCVITIRWLFYLSFFIMIENRQIDQKQLKVHHLSHNSALTPSGNEMSWYLILKKFINFSEPIYVSKLHTTHIKKIKLPFLLNLDMFCLQQPRLRKTTYLRVNIFSYMN